jgi:hypothetical protein
MKKIFLIILFSFIFLGCNNQIVVSDKSKFMCTNIELVNSNEGKYCVTFVDYSNGYIKQIFVYTNKEYRLQDKLIIE